MSNFRFCNSGFRFVSDFVLRASCFAWLSAECLAMPAFAADKADFEVHEWSFHVIDPTVKHANDKDHFANALPGLANSLREAPVAGAPVAYAPGSPAKSTIAPLAMLTFYGQPARSIDVTLRAASGRFLAHWPRGEEKNRRLQWRNIELLTAFDADRRAYVNPDHWVTRARGIEALEVKFGARQERFVAYDTELTMPLPLALTGGPDSYEIRNTGNVPLLDLALILPTKEGPRVAWLDRLPAKSKAGKPEATDGAAADGEATQLSLSAPLAVGGEELAAQTSSALRQRLIAAGLSAAEAELLLSICGKSIFESREMVAIFRLPGDAIDEKLPLEVLPEPKKTVRVALVLATSINPGVKEEIVKLVSQLGDPKYALREAAEKRLLELGPLAQAALKDALKQADLEIVHRSERILRRQNALPEKP